MRDKINKTFAHNFYRVEKSPAPEEERRDHLGTLSLHAGALRPGRHHSGYDRHYRRKKMEEKLRISEEEYRSPPSTAIK
jgi:hypothetical protein